jgi:hypothetical protein
MNCLVSVPRAARSEDPTDRLCPCGVPKEAMAERGPDGRMVPSVELENDDTLEQRATSRSLTNLRV